MVHGLKKAGKMANMFKINDKEIKDFERDLKAFAHKAFPFATKNTINQGAFQVQRFAREDVKSRFILRNQFTGQSIRVNQAKTLQVTRQAAFVGSTADYMEDQEFGATRVKKGSEGIPIVTSYATGEGLGARPRTRLAKRDNTLQNIRLRKRKSAGGTRKRRNLIAIRQAAAGGNKFIFLDFGRKQGIFKVIGGKRRPKLRMVWDLSEQSVTIKRRPWLKPAVDRTIPLMPGFYRDSLIFQLKRQNLFKG